MIQFTQTQKNEFDKLYARKDSLTLFQAMMEVQKYEINYPVLYLYLFNSDDRFKNQDNFSKIWSGLENISVEVEQYYLAVFNGMYVSLDPDQQIKFTAKEDYNVAYQKKFTDLQIDDLQQRPEFKNKINLDYCKVLVSEDDDNPITAPTIQGVTVTDTTATIAAI